MPFRSWVEFLLAMNTQETTEMLPYSEFRQGNYAIYKGRVVMVAYCVGLDKFIVAINRTKIKEVSVTELSAIELNENVLKQCSPVHIKEGEYIFEFEYGHYRISVSPINNYVELAIMNVDNAKIMFSNVVKALHTLQNIIMKFAKHPISFKETNDYNKE